MTKILVTLENELAEKFKSTVSRGNRSRLISKLIERELKRREDKLYKIALLAEQDETLNEEMKNWDITSGDGIE